MAVVGRAVTAVMGEFSVLGSQFSVKTEHSAWSLITAFFGPVVRQWFLERFMGRSYRDLIAWQKAMKLVAEIYGATRRFPREECYGLTNQLRRAAVSVPSNIAEGQARFSQKEFHHFLSQARGSLVEIETQLLIAKDLEYLE
jgi:four helix bundle protein